MNYKDMYTTTSILDDFSDLLKINDISNKVISDCLKHLSKEDKDTLTKTLINLSSILKLDGISNNSISDCLKQLSKEDKETLLKALQSLSVDNKKDVISYMNDIITRVSKLLNVSTKPISTDVFTTIEDAIKNELNSSCEDNGKSGNMKDLFEINVTTDKKKHFAENSDNTVFDEFEKVSECKDSLDTPVYAACADLNFSKASKDTTLNDDVCKPQKTKKYAHTFDGKLVEGANPYKRKPLTACLSDVFVSGDKEKHSDMMCPDLKKPDKTKRFAYNANGEYVEGANPYSTTRKDKDNKELRNIKNNLLKEIESEKPNIDELVDAVISKLNDSKTHDYKVTPSHDKIPASAQVVVYKGTYNFSFDELSEITTKLESYLEVPKVLINFDNVLKNYTAIIVLE